MFLELTGAYIFPECEYITALPQSTWVSSLKHDCHIICAYAFSSHSQASHANTFKTAMESRPDPSRPILDAFWSIGSQADEGDT